MDKLKVFVFGNKKCFVFLVGLLIIGVLFGSSLPLFLNDADRFLVSDYLNQFTLEVSNGIDSFFVLKNGLINNLFFSFLIWIFGVSVIGVPIVLFLFFSKCFVVGFSISSIIINYGFKGILFSLVYIFPHLVVNIFIYGIITNYSLLFSFKLINFIFKKGNFDIGLAFNKYFKIYLVSVIILGVSLLYEVFINPIVLRFVFDLLSI